MDKHPATMTAEEVEAFAIRMRDAGASRVTVGVVSISFRETPPTHSPLTAPAEPTLPLPAREPRKLTEEELFERECAEYVPGTG